MQAAGVPVLSFHIDDSSLHRVTSDGINGGWYQDYRLVPPPEETPNPDFCVEASPQGGGFTFIRFNRKVDGDAGSMHCVPWAQQVHRQYYLHIDESTGDACAELAASSTGTPDPSSTGCDLTGYANPRMRIEKLYASKPSKTPITFLIARSYPENPVSYEIRSDSDGTVAASPDGNVRILTTTTQTFRLWRFEDGVRGSKAINSPFVLPMQITFQRTVMSQ